MYTKIEPFLLYCISSVHAGSGSEIGLVDLPIQREQHTSYPKIESSSLKGAIRSTVDEKISQTNDAKKQKQLELVFGSAPIQKNKATNENDRNSEKKDETQSGAIAFSDARILLFPVKSIRGVFAWVTCPYVVKRFINEMTMYLPTKDSRKNQVENLKLPKPNTVPSLQSSNLIAADTHIILEEYTYKVTEDSATEQFAQLLNNWLFNKMDLQLEKQLVVLSDDDFTDFVKLSTEVNARIRIDPKTGTVQDKALWYEENVPPETVFYSFLFAGNTRVINKEDFYSDEEVMQFLQCEKNFPDVFQLGGNSTLGRGMLRKVWIE